MNVISLEAADRLDAEDGDYYAAVFKEVAEINTNNKRVLEESSNMQNKSSLARVIEDS